MLSFMELLFSGVLERHPHLRVAFPKAGASWVPYWLFPGWRRNGSAFGGSIPTWPRT